MSTDDGNEVREMGWGTARDVRFDWEGSLAIARRLWETADGIDTSMANRVTAAEGALVDWLGLYGDEFVTRIDAEARSASSIATGFREGANAWAFQWKSAMDEQNRILHAREEQRVKDDRSLADDYLWSWNGHDDLPPAPAEVPVPSAPGFAATASFVRY